MAADANTTSGIAFVRTETFADQDTAVDAAIAYGCELIDNGVHQRTIEKKQNWQNRPL